MAIASAAPEYKIDRSFSTASLCRHSHLDLPTLDFLRFARLIYDEQPQLHHERFLLPALYGGHADNTYNALVVFQDPSLKFTVDRWRRCRTPEEAVGLHREIFFAWASQGKPAILFRALDRAFKHDGPFLESCAAFFHRYYVTDIWKGGEAAAANVASRSYWLQKLSIELEQVPTQCVVFVGKQALAGKQLVPSNIPTFEVPFPRQWVSNDGYTREVESCIAAMRADSVLTSYLTQQD